MDLELLKKEAADLETQVQAAKLQKDIKEKKAELAKSVEVLSDPVRITRDMQAAAKDGDFDKFTKEYADKMAMEMDAKIAAREAKQQSIGSSQKIYFSKEVQKALASKFGTKSGEVLALAKDISSALPRMDGVAQMLKKHVSELTMFKTQFGEFSKDEVDYAIKALSTSGSGTGAEYVLTGWQDQIAQRLEDVNVCLANLPVIDLPNNPYRIPIYTAIPTTYYVTEGATVSSSDPTSSNKDLDARKVANRVVYSGEMVEDAIFAILPFAEKIMMESLGNAIERVLLFGDTVATASTNINKIDGTPTTTAGGADVYLTRNGLIKETFGSNGKTTDISSDIVAGLATSMQKMGVGALNMKDLVNFCNIQLAFKFMANSNFLSFDKLADKASLLVGMVGSIFGVPLVPTSGIPLTDSAGKIPAAGGTLGSLLVAKRSGVLVGFKRRPQIVDNDILQAADQRAWVASTRIDVKVIQPNASDRAAVSYGYNATV